MLVSIFKNIHWSDTSNAFWVGSVTLSAVKIVDISDFYSRSPVFKFVYNILTLVDSKATAQFRVKSVSPKIAQFPVCVPEIVILLSVCPIANT